MDLDQQLQTAHKGASDDSYLNPKMGMKKAAVNFQGEDESGLNSLEVMYDGNSLTYKSFDEKTVAGYNFEMQSGPSGFTVTEDSSSSIVPGSMVLWVLAYGFSDPISAEQEMGEKSPKVPMDVVIPEDLMENAVKKLMQEDIKDLEIRSS